MKVVVNQVLREKTNFRAWMAAPVIGWGSRDSPRDPAEEHGDTDPCAKGRRKELISKQDQEVPKAGCSSCWKGGGITGYK